MRSDLEGEGGAEATSARGNFVATSGDQLNFEYRVGCIESEDLDPFFQAAFIAVVEVEGAILCAVPEGAWHKTKKKRHLPADCLRKPVAVVVPACLGADRTRAEDSPSFKIWLGMLDAKYEDLVHYGDEEPTVNFPSDSEGVPKVPFAEALFAIARDQFAFQTAESGAAVVAPPGLGSDPQMQSRIENVEKTLLQMQETLMALRSQAVGAAPKAHAAPAPPVQGPRHVDPAVARQALQAGVTPAALQEMAGALDLQLPPQMFPGAAAAPAKEIDSEEEEEEDLDASGSQQPVEKAVVQMSKLLLAMNREKKLKKDKSLEGILDYAEGGSALGKESSGSRSKAAALRSLRGMLKKQPALLYRAIETRMQEDWDSMGMMPGMGVSTLTARGWIEHRSRIQNFAAAVRTSWMIGGIWDALRANRPEEARARCALSIAMLDQQSYDKGGWLLSGEIALEDNPPYAAFGLHKVPELWESPHTKLIDDRWFELMLSKLKDMSEFQERKAKLTAGTKKEDLTEQEKESARLKKKGAGKGKKGEGENPQTQS